jgi:hypothetical protein
VAGMDWIGGGALLPPLAASSLKLAAVMSCC